MGITILKVRQAALCVALFAGCGNESIKMDDADRDAAVDASAGVGGRVHGRVTDVDGKPVANAAVRVGKQSGTTDKAGRFSFDVEGEGELQVAVDSKKYSSGAGPVQVKNGGDTHVELAVKTRTSVMASVAADGVTAAKDGVTVKVPKGGLVTKNGEPAVGMVEVAYTVVNEPKHITAAPGRMETEAKGALEGYGMVELRFFQGDDELVLSKMATIEVPLGAMAAVDSGKKVAGYKLGTEDARWKSASEVTVQNGKLLLSTASAGWIGAARALPVDSCVSGRLKAKGAGAANTSIRAARARGLSLVQADTGDDGSFCLPVTPDDDWSVSTYFDDGSATGLGLTVDVVSSDAVGMCGGDGCKKVGDVDLPVLAQ
jgi:hypothetical protein